MIVRAWESDEHYNAEIRVDHVRDVAKWTFETWQHRMRDQRR